MRYRLIKLPFFLFLLTLAFQPTVSEAKENVLIPVSSISQAEILKRVNHYYNRHFSYRREADDRWLQENQFLAQGGGDCEDFALIKYRALLKQGLRQQDFYFVYVRLADSNEYHILLRHHPTDSLLDSLTDDMRPLNRRPELRIEFQFTANQFLPGRIKRLTRRQLNTLQRWQYSIRLAENI